MLDQAEEADRDKEDSQKLPEELVRREKLRAKMDRACEQLEERAKKQAIAQTSEWEMRMSARNQRQGNRKRPEAKSPRQTSENKVQINLTGPDARLMRKNKRDSDTQNHSAQAVVDAEGSQLIIGQRVTTENSDQLPLAMDAA